MTIKQFLKPDWRKFVIFLLFFILTYIWVYDCGDINSSISCEAHGFPMTYWSHYTISKIPLQAENTISYFELIADLIIWYLLSCLVIWIYDKVKKKK